MKRIMLGIVEVRGASRPVAQELIGFLLSAPEEKGSRNGWSLACNRARSKVLDKFEALSADAEYVDLEDAEHETLKKAVENSEFQIIDRGIPIICDRVLSAATPT